MPTGCKHSLGRLGCNDSEGYAAAGSRGARLAGTGERRPNGTQEITGKGKQALTVSTISEEDSKTPALTAQVAYNQPRRVTRTGPMGWAVAGG